MNLYKFELTVNGYLLRVHFSASEESGLKWCKRIGTEFQNNVANLEIKVDIHKSRNKSMHGIITENRICMIGHSGKSRLRRKIKRLNHLLLCKGKLKSLRFSSYRLTGWRAF